MKLEWLKRLPDLLWGVFILAAILMLVRPGSAAATWVQDFFAGLVGLVQLAVSG